MELFKLFSPVIPVFFLIGVGFVFAHWKKNQTEKKVLDSFYFKV
jgi:predicted permease